MCTRSTLIRLSSGADIVGLLSIVYVVYIVNHASLAVGFLQAAIRVSWRGLHTVFIHPPSVTPCAGVT